MALRSGSGRREGGAGSTPPLLSAAVSGDGGGEHAVGLASVVPAVALDVPELPGVVAAGAARGDLVAVDARGVQRLDVVELVGEAVVVGESCSGPQPRAQP